MSVLLLDSFRYSIAPLMFSKINIGISLAQLWVHVSNYYLDYYFRMPYVATLLWYNGG